MKFILDILKGIVVGVANAIPGVSGGTMMVSMGIYDDIIESITHIFKNFKKSFMTLLPIILGMAVGIVGLAFAITFLFENFEFQTKMAFIGLILGGVPMIFGKVKSKKPSILNFILFLVFMVAIICMEYFGGSGKSVVLHVNPLQMLLLFLVGMVASATMVIPGVSGSMMLMIMGYYKPVLGCVKDFVSALKDMDFNTMLKLCCYLVPFGLGVILGIYFVAKLIESLLKKHESLTYSAILGLIASSPIVILMGTKFGALGAVEWTGGVVCLVAGTVAVLFLGRQ